MTNTVNVPREPTLEMWSAGERAFDRDPDLHHETVLANVWTAMLAAAPKVEPVQVDSSSGSIYDRLLTFIHDRDDALRGDDRTDPHEVDESVLEIMRIACVSSEAPKVEQAPVAWTETFIAEEEDGPAVGILIDMPDGSQIWTGEVSDALLNASNERPDESGIFLVVARKSEGMRVVASVATPEDGFELARLIASRAPHTHPAPASDELLEALAPFARYYDLNDCHERRPDDALEVPISDLARAADLIAKHKGPQS